MNNKRLGKKGSLALKLDISKSYDRVEWGFLKGIMSKMDLPNRWIDRVMCCMTSASFSVCINGKAYGNIRPSRGLHQGDPLSPYLFLLCVESFTSLLARAQNEGRIHGVAVCRRAPCISHLLFAEMTLYYFVGPPKGRCRLFLNYCRHIQMPQDNALILISPQSTSVQIQPWIKGRELKGS